MAKYDIPDHLLDQLYVPVNPSPNSDVFTRNKEQRLPIPVLGLDNGLVWSSDMFHDLDIRINNIIVGGLGIQGTENQLVVFAANNALMAIDLQQLLNNLGALNFNGSNINAGTIYGASIRNQTLTTNLYALGSVTNPILGAGAVTNVNMANGAVTLPKMRSTGHSCFIIGNDANHTYTELPVAANYYIPTRIPGANLPSMQPFLNFWNAQTANTLTGVKLTDGSVAGAKLTNTSVDLSKLNSGTQIACVLGSGAGTNNVSAILAPTNAYSILSGGRGNDVGFREISNVLNNAPRNQTLGTLLQDNTMPKTKLQNSGQVAPFCMGYIAANGSAQKVFNCTSSRLSLGLYKITFLTAAPDAKYIVTFGNEDNGGNYVTNCFVVGGSRTTASFNVQVWGSGGVAQDEGFNFVVYAF